MVRIAIRIMSTRVIFIIYDKAHLLIVLGVFLRNLASLKGNKLYQHE